MKRAKKLILASICILSIIALSVMVSNGVLSRFAPPMFEIGSSRTSNEFLDNFKTNTVNIEDINMSYKVFGKGTPILLISGSGGTMDNWNPAFLRELSSSHTVIVFDNRGIGGTTAGAKKFSITQFSEDAGGLLDALKIKRADVLGISMGGMIAQELVLGHPGKVGKIILVSTWCGPNEDIPKYDKRVQNELKKALTNSTFLNSPEGIKLINYLKFPEQWLEQNPGQLKDHAGQAKMLNIETFEGQMRAVETWDGACDRLKKINDDALVITGTEDIVAPAAHSLILAVNIPGAWLVPIEGGGHGIIEQYPEKLAEIILAFLKDSYF